jgi:hypothetical protein
VRLGLAGNPRIGVLQPCANRLILSLGGSPGGVPFDVGKGGSALPALSR